MTKGKGNPDVDTPGYVSLQVPEHLYLRCLAFLGTADAQPEALPVVDGNAELARMRLDRIHELERERAGGSELEDEVVRLTRENEALREQVDAEHRAALRERTHYDKLAEQYDPLLSEVARLQDQILNLIPLQVVDLPGGLGYYDTLLAKEQATEPATPTPAVDLAPSTPEVDHADDDRPAPAAVAEEAPAVPEPEAPRGRTPGVATDYESRGKKATATETAKHAGPIAEFLEATTVRGRDPEDFVPGPTLRGLYATWAEAAGKPKITDRQFGLGMTAAGYRKKQSSQYIGGSKPILYYGIRLRTEADNAPAPEPEPEPQPEPQPEAPPQDPTNVIREQINRARKANARVEDKDADRPPTPFVAAKKAAAKPAPILAVKNHEARPDKDWAGTKVIASNGVVTTVDAGYVEVDAPENAAPIPPEKADARTFDLWTDLKGGCDRPFVYLPEVLELAGLDQDAVESAVRHPERVEIRPESVTKGYPVLAFSRGDMQAVLGFRDQMKPAVIAAYWRPLLEHDRHIVDRHGGGGAKKGPGLPTTVKASVKALRQRGFTIPDEWERATQPVEVCYDGQTLGKMKVHLANKAQVQGDYQRLLRQAHAIDRRKVGASA